MTTTARNVTLTPTLAKWIDEQITTGRYGTASEVVRAGLRLLIDQEKVEHKLVERSARKRAAGA